MVRAIIWLSIAFAMPIVGSVATAFVLLTFLAKPASGISITTFEDPLGATGTLAVAISGNLIAGTFNDSKGNEHGFLYDGSTFKTIDDPAATTGTFVTGISGNTVVAQVQYGSSMLDHGVLYNGSTFTPLDDPQAMSVGTFPEGISGNDVVGFYDSGEHSFLYNGSTYAAFDDPLGYFGTYAQGISGANIVGYYYDSNFQSHGFLYNGSSFVTLDDPQGHDTDVIAISGRNIIGSYYDFNGHEYNFLFNGSTYTTLVDIGGIPNTQITGISGDTVVGWYLDKATNHAVSFIATIPEPSTLVLAAIGAFALLAYRRRC